ncbi:hypothetical protein LMG24238_06898 [Paraburkholderia sediminicola]|uniref:DUF2635 domain-containing protein n=1 Tax=Paraburkholderia sediminicola TaxID=458836 RepID=A0A6J5CS92_9BURK|nr:DUF2635 domain-containing protein [Paraburkholderia sediminicola]CAB3742538.1 hypothetical protein LMG24238_06898 [Paraburkholderia sediminicola]
MFVKPAPGVLLRDPVTKQLLSDAPVGGLKTTVVPPEGMKVSDFDKYWLRRIHDRDAVKVSDVTDAQATSTTSNAGTVQKVSDGEAETGAN